MHIVAGLEMQIAGSLKCFVNLAVNKSRVFSSRPFIKRMKKALVHVTVLAVG